MPVILWLLGMPLTLILLLVLLRVVYQPNFPGASEQLSRPMLRDENIRCVFTTAAKGRCSGMQNS